MKVWFAALAAVVLLNAGCGKSQEDIVTEWLSGKGFSEIKLTLTTRLHYDFTARKQGVACTGTATVTELTRSYQARERVTAEWQCR